LIGRSMAASPGNRRFGSNPETGRHRTGAGAAQSSGPAEAATGSLRRSSTGFTGTRLQPGQELGVNAIAGPGEAGWNPVDAHTRKTILPIPFDPIEGDASRRGDLPFSRQPCRNPAVTEPDLAASVEPLHQVAPANHPAGMGPVRVVRPTRGVEPRIFLPRLIDALSTEFGQCLPTNDQSVHPDDVRRQEDFFHRASLESAAAVGGVHPGSL